MIGSLRGTIIERHVDGTVLLEVGGVGYLVTVSLRAIPELEPGSTAFLLIHHHIREQEQTLFGFTSIDDKTTFQTLLATHGVGPSLAMAVLATHPPAALIDVVANNDVAALQLVPKVGKKTAERLIVELKNRLSIAVLDGSANASGGGSSVADVREALTGLGYGTDEIREVLRELPSDRDSATLLREALKALGARRA
ncbi:MAG: Holliday junction branch migration protein RuvA [Ilumatobacter sp.]|uniref:Holliday junction branch migration protein RuvA n=1 Tax=Ilumatobacter sp. TaxID=1967498 RepID=UPI00391B8032